MQHFLDTLINGPARYTQEHNFSPIWALIFIILILLLELGIAHFIFILIINFTEHRQVFIASMLRNLGIGLIDTERTFLQLSLPININKSVYATEQLHILLSTTVKYRGFWDRLSAEKRPYSLELISTHDGGIRYVICIPKRETEAVKSTLLSFLPGLKIKEIDDYLENTIKSDWNIVELILSRDFVLPLINHQRITEHDPIAYITGQMHGLLPNELIALQIVCVPIYDNTHPNELRHIRKIQERILTNEEISHLLSPNKIDIKYALLRVTFAPFWFIAKGMKIVLLVAKLFSTNYVKRNSQPSVVDINPQHITEAIKTKLDQHLFEVSIRFLVSSSNTDKARKRLDALVQSFNIFDTTNQSLVSRRTASYASSNSLLNRFQNRQLQQNVTTQQTILSSSELANIYHFPASETNTENFVMSLSRILAPPLSTADKTTYDIVLGRNFHRDIHTDVGLSSKEREKHVFIVGGTGNGKTTMLQFSIVQDIQNNKGVAIVDPHGDMAELMLHYIPNNRIKDVIYFNPDDLSYPIGLNILELTPGLEGDDLLREKDLVTESTVSIFRKIFSEDDSGGHRIEYILRNAVQTALTIKDATLFTVYNLLNDPSYRKIVILTLENEDLQNFWKNEFSKAGNFQQVKMLGGITAKIGRFLFSASAKRILEQPKSTIDFDDILNGKILICNLSKGLLGEDTSELFGIAVLAKIQMAALRRARIKQNEREPFYLYVDEFQNFATQSFVQMLSESRKYKLFLIMAEQSASQQDDQKMVDIILANVGTVICFRTGSPYDEKLMLPLFRPYIQDGDIANLPPYSFYMRASATRSQEPFSGETLLLNSIDGNAHTAELVIESSRKQYVDKNASSTLERNRLRKKMLNHKYSKN